jgi:DNA-binding GntR family transcriptional regulator
MALIRPGGRPVTMQTVERLQVIAERYVVKHLEPSGRPARASSEHRALFDAWAAGDARKATDLSAAHISATLADLRDELERTR